MDESKKQFVHQLTLSTLLVVSNYLPESVSLTIESGGVNCTAILSEVCDAISYSWCILISVWSPVLPFIFFSFIEHGNYSKKFCVLIFNRWKLPFIILVLHMTWVWKSMCNHQILSSLVLKNSEQWLSSVGPSFQYLKSWPFIQICQMVVDICTIKFAIQGVLCVMKHLNCNCFALF